MVTDIAARGIDIPNLDYVINFHFPGKPKLFIHRVGRCARAGRSGTAYSIFSTEDEAHVVDLTLFLNKPFDLKNNDMVGVCPPELVEEEHLLVMKFMQEHDMASTFRISNNAYKAYIQTRPVASVESNKRVKNLRFSLLKPLVDFSNGQENITMEVDVNADFKSELLSKMKQYKAKTTIFELNRKPDSAESLMMAQKRKVHENKIARHHLKQEELHNDGSTQVIYFIHMHFWI